MKWSLVKIMNNILLDSAKSFSKEGTFKLELYKDTTINIESDNVKLYLVTKNNIKVDFNILFPFLLFPLRLFPALSLLPGHTPAHELICPTVGNLFIS